MPEPTTTAFAILGLLTYRPMSRYELAAHAAQTVAHFWTIPQSQIYSELPRLERAGLVRAVEHAESAPPHYRLTPAGRKALLEWLKAPVTERDRFRSAFLVKFFFAGRLSPQAARELLLSYRAAVLEYAETLAAIAEHGADSGDSPYAVATARFGERLMRAAHQWTKDSEALTLRSRTQ